VIRIIQEIAEYVYRHETNRELLERARRLFGYAEEDRADPSRSPILKYFHAQKVVPGQWGRVAPGTVHSWQGGGNFLIELAQRSDNTFRILDFGREFSKSLSEK
jgi:mannose-6-phosphate isomerase class I